MTAHSPLAFAAAALLAAAQPAAAAGALTDVTVTRQGAVTTLRIPSGPCTSVRASPVVVADYVVLPMHARSPCTAAARYDRSLLALHLPTRQVVELADNVGTEGTPLFHADTATLYWNLVFGGSVRIVDLAGGRVSTPQPAPRTTSDVSGVWLDGHYYFATINTPEASCQSPVNDDCGVIFKVDATGTVRARLDRSRGFRSWVAAGLTTDGTHLYAGGSEQWLGSSDATYLYGCTLVKLDTALNIVATFDPGDRGCYRTGRGGNDEDAISGEVVVGRDDLWVQWKSPTAAGRNVSLLVRLDRNLRELCRVERATGPLDSTAYYGGVTLDRHGNAWVPLTLYPNGRRTATLLKVTRDCSATVVAEIADASAKSSPALVDDLWVLWATDGKLSVWRQDDGRAVGTLALASSAGVSASPAVAGGQVIVVQEDGTVTVVDGLGLGGYGQALWPRYRRNNHGDPLRGGNG